MNEGELRLSGKNLNFGGRNLVYFLNYGTIFDEEVIGTAYISGAPQGSWIINYGKYLKSGIGTREVRFTTFTNNGEIEVENGQFNLPASNEPDTGSFWIGNKGRLSLASPRTIKGPVHCAGFLDFGYQYVISVMDTFEITGRFRSNPYGWLNFDPGCTLLINSMEVPVGSNISFNTGSIEMIDSLILSGSGIKTNDTLIIKKYANLLSGWIGEGAGVIAFDEGANINVSKNITFLGQINNYGNILWNSGNITLYYKNDGNFTMINNYGLFIDKTDVSSSVKMATGNGTVFRHFNNYGTYLKKNLSSTVFSSGISFTNKETGVLKGIGTISFGSPVENSGIVSPGDSVGILNLIADYPSDFTTILNIDLDGADRDEYDLLDIDGGATLKGTLNISLLNGYIPEEGEVFEIMKFTSRTDTFDVINGTEISNCRYFAVQYSDTSVRLEVYGIEPPQAAVDSISFRQDRPVEINVLANDTDPDGDTLTVPSVSNPAHGTAVISGDSTITYTPETGFVGLDTVIYVIQKRLGCIDSSMAIVDVLSTVGIEEFPFDSPNSFHIEQNYPNPFDGFTTFHFSIPEEAFVELRIYSIHGKLIKVLVSRKLPVGSYNYDWKTPGLTEGIYIYKFSAGEFNQTGKMFKMK